MDASERLAALLAGELDADERTELEAELARDPELRTNLDAMERADAHLAELRSPEPPDGFEQRLEDRVAASLVEVLGAPADEPRGASTHATDEFTSRRRDRASRRMQAMIGVAAAAVVLVGSGVLFTSLGGDDDAEMADDSGLFSTTEDAADDAGDADEAAEMEAAVADGPVVVADERALVDDDLDELLAGGELDVVASERYDAEVGSEVAGRFQADLGARVSRDAGVGGRDLDTEEADPDGAPQPESAEDEAADDGTADDDPQLFARDGTPLSPTQGADVSRCLEEVLAAGPDAIPVYAELATYQDTEAVVLGLVTLDPDTGAFTRSELWVLERPTCQLLRFSQG